MAGDQGSKVPRKVTEAHGFGEVLGDPGGEATFTVAGTREGGEGQDGDPGEGRVRMASDAAGHFESVHAGHLNVQKDDFRACFQEEAQSLFPPRHREDFESMPDQVGGHEGAIEIVVLGQEDPDGTFEREVGLGPVRRGGRGGDQPGIGGVASRERHAEAASDIRLALHGDAAVEKLGEALDDGESKPGPGVGTRVRMDPGEWLEQGGNLVRGDTTTGVGDGEGDGEGIGGDGEGDESAGRGEADGVGEEIDQDLLETKRVCEDKDVIGRGMDDEFEIPAFGLGTEDSDGAGDDVCDWARFDLEPDNPRLKSGQVQEILGQPGQVSAAFLDQGKAAPLVFERERGIRIAQPFRERQDAGERCTELMADPCEEFVPARRGGRSRIQDAGIAQAFGLTRRW